MNVNDPPPARGGPEREEPSPGPALAPLTPPETFIQQCKTLGVEFDAGDLQRLGLYLAMLLDANTRFNLTAITDPEQAWTRHMLDSLTLLPCIVSADQPESAAKQIIDVGSGGGLPGIPLAIALPQGRFVLLEATGKKARFLESVVRRLELTNVQVVTDRAESIGQDREHHREQYDFVTARAVGRLPMLLELTVPLARVGGFVLAMKGQQAQEEVAQAKAALHLLHAHVVDSIATPTGTIVIIQKQRPTPKLYPRRPGEPKRDPLGGIQSGIPKSENSQDDG